jgi:hypothetical protein
MERWKIAPWPSNRGELRRATHDHTTEQPRDRDREPDDGEYRWRATRLLASLVAGALGSLFGAMAAALTNAPVWLVFVTVVGPVWGLLGALLYAIWPYLRRPG